jgi:hypothetical protein
MVQQVYEPGYEVEENEVDTEGDQKVGQRPERQRWEYHKQIDQESDDKESPHDLYRNPKMVIDLQDLQTVGFLPIFDVSADRDLRSGPKGHMKERKNKGCQKTQS